MDVTFPAWTVYSLVIDTDAYSGNFERQLAGYTTGVWDYERAHGEEEAEDAKKANPSLTQSMEDKSLALTHDEYGEVTNTIRATPGRRNNGMGWHYDASDASAVEEARARSVQAMRDRQAGQIAMCERRLTEQDFEVENGRGAWTKEATERTLKSAHDSIERAGNFVGFPAYESVAMFFSEPLTVEEMAFVRQRAHEYAAQPFGDKSWRQKPFNIRDIYMVEVTDGVEERLDL